MGELFNMASDLISNVGFPIFVCILLLKDQKESREAHQKETEGFVEAINNNTLAITQLKDKIGE